jgi:hypothetical protein
VDCSSKNIIIVFKSRNMRWAGHVTHMGETRNAYTVLIGKPEGQRQHGGNLDGGMLLKWLLKCRV